MTDKYEILPVKSSSSVPQGFEDIAKEGVLPIHPFFMCVFASPKSGKSNLIMNLIFNKNMNFKDRFDAIYWISPTIDADRTCRHVMDDEEIIKIHEPDDIEAIDDIMKVILKEQKDANKEGPFKTLIVMDDMLGRLRGTSLITTISSKYRHYNCSFIVVSQTLKSIDPIIRQCASHWILFKTENQKEFDKIVEEFNGYPDFATIYKVNTSDKYTFIYIDINKVKIHKNFGEIVYIKK